MAIDMTQFRQVFFEESLEGLDAMESSLLQLSKARLFKKLFAGIMATISMRLSASWNQLEVTLQVD